MPAVVAVLALVLGVSVAASPAGATPVPYYYAYAGGLYLKVNDNTITTDVSAPSIIVGTGAQRKTSHAAAATVNGVGTINGVNTSAVATAVTGGLNIVSTASTAGISLLNGVVTASALTTKTTAKITTAGSSATTTSTFLGLKVGGVSLPNLVKQNTSIVVPNVATVSLNFVQYGKVGSQVEIIASGIVITLLKPFGDHPIGTAIEVGPTLIAGVLASVPPTGHGLGGEAYGSKIHAVINGVGDVVSDPTAFIPMPFGGTSGMTQTRSVASVDLGAVGTIGGVTDTINGINSKTAFLSSLTSHIAQVNLLNGLIKADGIYSAARVAGGAITDPGIRGSSKLVNLVIAGHAIPITASPNTTLNIAGLGKVVLNQQIKSFNQITVRAVDITLGTAQAGLPVGAEIQLGVSHALGM
jgi:hypothetical protein